MIRRLIAELVDGAGAVLGEGPSWDARTGELSWVDLLSGSVRVHDGHGDHRTTFDVGGHVSSALPAEDGGWLLTTADGFARLDRDGSVHPLLAVVGDRPELRFNDAKCDPWGQALAGTMRYDEQTGSATLYRLEGAADGGPGGPEGWRARPLLEGIGLSNGLAWSADARTFYFIDTLARSVASHPYRPDEDHLGPRHEVVAVDPAAGMPDGMCVDATGSLWVALYGGGAVHRYTPDGVLDTVVTVPVPCPTSVAFGGPAGDRLFITSGGGWGRPNSSGAGGLWAVDPGTTGAPATPWRAPYRPAPAGRTGQTLS
jgi:sugar lactone lactonase YvrE